jgi:hypothetical protein
VLLKHAPADAFTVPVRLVLDDKRALAGRPLHSRAQAACEVLSDGSAAVYVTEKLATGQPASGPRGVLSGSALHERQVGVLAHELAHVHLLLRDVEHTEHEADDVAEGLFGYRVYYDDDNVQTTDRVAGHARSRPKRLVPNRDRAQRRP